MAPLFQGFQHFTVFSISAFHGFQAFQLSRFSPGSFLPEHGELWCGLNLTSGTYLLACELLAQPAGEDGRLLVVQAQWVDDQLAVVEQSMADLNRWLAAPQVATD